MNNALALVTLLLLLVTGCAGAPDATTPDTSDAGEPAVEPVGGSGGQGGQAQAGTPSGGAPVQTAGTGGQAPTAGAAGGGVGGQPIGGSAPTAGAAGSDVGGMGGQAGEAGTPAGGSAGSDVGGSAPTAGTGGQPPVEPNACEVPLATARDCTGTCADAPNGTACTGTCAGMAAGNCTPPATGFQSADGYVVLAAHRGTRWALPANACARFTAMEGGGAGYLLPGGAALVEGETKAGSTCMVAHNNTNGPLPVDVTSTWKKSWVRVEVSFGCDLICD